MPKVSADVRSHISPSCTKTHFVSLKEQRVSPLILDAIVTSTHR